MRPTWPSLVLLLAALVLAAPAPAADAAPKKKDKCEKAKKRGDRPPKGCGGGGDDDPGDELWETKWRFADVKLDGRFDGAYSSDDTNWRYTGKVTYRSNGIGGFLDLRPKEAVAPGLFTGTATGVRITSTSTGTLTRFGRPIACNHTLKPVSKGGLAAVVSIRKNMLHMQWSLMGSIQRCPEPISPLFDHDFPTSVLTSDTPRGSHYGNTKHLDIDIDETVRDTYGKTRVRWKGTVTLKKASAIGQP